MNNAVVFLLNMSVATVALPILLAMAWFSESSKRLFRLYQSYLRPSCSILRKLMNWIDGGGVANRSAYFHAYILGLN